MCVARRAGSASRPARARPGPVVASDAADSGPRAAGNVVAMIAVDGLLNLRDLGGTPTEDGRIVQPGRLWRSENQSLLSEDALDALVDGGLSDVIDLRSDFEVDGSPSPFADRSGVTYHHLSFFKDAEDDDAGILGKALPWLERDISEHTGDEAADTYLTYLHDRPDSVLAAVQAIAHAPGAALVHCAVGKDRTGLTVAFALNLVGVSDEAIAADYAATTANIANVALRLWEDPTYSMNARDIDMEELAARPEAMLTVLDHLRAEYGGVRPLLTRLGWSDADDAALRRHLLDA